MIIVQGENMTQISISEFRKNLKKYTDAVKEEDILVFNNGRPVMRICDPNRDKVVQLKKLRGIIKTDLTYEEIMEGKLTDL